MFIENKLCNQLLFHFFVILALRKPTSFSLLNCQVGYDVKPPRPSALEKLDPKVKLWIL